MAPKTRAVYFMRIANLAEWELLLDTDENWLLAAGGFFDGVCQHPRLLVLRSISRNDELLHSRSASGSGCARDRHVTRREDTQREPAHETVHEAFLGLDRRNAPWA